MDTRYEKLNLFFEKIKNIGFWQRIFGWRQIRNLSYEAYEEFKKLLNSLDHVIKEIDQSKGDIDILKNDNEHFRSGKIELEKEVTSLKERINLLSNNLSQSEKENAAYKQTENDRRVRFESEIANIVSLKKQIQEEWQKEQDELQKKEIERIQLMKETWAKHQENVKNNIKIICQRHTIEYVDKVPFKGSPDNTIKICDEFIIFEAKSPASSDNLQNFPSYLKTQTESVKKYVKEENVRRDIFLVIPSNTVTVIEQFSYNMGDYNVYLVTLDVLEPLMLTLKKIEDYEFVNELAPEERENICRIIGKFAHMSKRRIQIDHFFAWEFLDILTKCKNLPREILDKVIEFEKAEKLNPPQERRAKQIPTAELESDTEKIQREAEAKAVIFPPSLPKDLKSLPLYEDEEA